MGHADQKYYTRVLAPVAFNVQAGTATGTASGHVVTNTDAIELPKVIKRTVIENVRVKVRTAPTPTTTKMAFLNGTDTFAVATIGTSTANVSVDASMTAANGTLAADVEPTVTMIGTTTASANQALGNYDIYWEQREAYNAA